MGPAPARYAGNGAAPAPAAEAPEGDAVEEPGFLEYIVPP